MQPRAWALLLNRSQDNAVVRGGLLSLAGQTPLWAIGEIKATGGSRDYAEPWLLSLNSE